MNTQHMAKNREIIKGAEIKNGNNNGLRYVYEFKCELFLLNVRA